MLTEYHCHVLPGLDDGSNSLGTSLAMLEMMKEQGVKRVIFTPHFYCHEEESVESFLEKRQAAFDPSFHPAAHPFQSHHCLKQPDYITYRAGRKM